MLHGLRNTSGLITGQPRSCLQQALEILLLHAHKKHFGLSLLKSQAASLFPIISAALERLLVKLDSIVNLLIRIEKYFIIWPKIAAFPSLWQRKWRITSMNRWRLRRSSTSRRRTGLSLTFPRDCANKFTVSATSTSSAD